MKNMYIIGSGGFSKQVIEIVENININKNEYKLLGLIDDDRNLLGMSTLGYKVVGDTKYLMEKSETMEIYAVIAIGNGKIRSSISKKLPNIMWINLIHPRAIISKYASIGYGNIICAGVIINPDCQIGNHCNINIGSTLGHDVVLDDYSTIMPGCNISGNVNVGKYSTIGTGTAIIQGINIDSNSFIGAGSVVINNIPSNCTAVGVPARPIKVDK